MVNLDDYSEHRKEDSVVLVHTGIDRSRFLELVRNMSYIQTFKELRDVSGEDISILYKLVFPDDLEVTPQVYSSVSSDFSNSELEGTIIQQNEDSIIISVPKLERDIVSMKSAYPERLSE